MSGKTNKYRQLRNHHGVEAGMTGAIGHLTFTADKRHNALTLAGWLAIPLAIDALVEAKARVIVVTGQGRSFSAGADISEFDLVRGNAKSARLYEASNVKAFDALRHCPVPVIAKIRGFCLGGGFGLAAACDLRLATPEAKFSVPAAKLGLGYPASAMADIANAVGRQRTCEMLFTARRYSAQEMKDHGFLLDVIADALLDDAVGSLCNEIASLAPMTHRATKHAIAAATGGDQALAEKVSDATFDSDDYREGRSAFKEKRMPNFRDQ